MAEEARTPGGEIWSRVDIGFQLSVRRTSVTITAYRKALGIVLKGTKALVHKIQKVFGDNIVVFKKDHGLMSLEHELQRLFKIIHGPKIFFSFGQMNFFETSPRPCQPNDFLVFFLDRNRKRSVYENMNLGLTGEIASPQAFQQLL